MELNIGIETVTFLFRYLISFERKIFNFRLFEKPPKGQGWRVSNELKISLLLPYEKTFFCEYFWYKIHKNSFFLNVII